MSKPDESVISRSEPRVVAQYVTVACDNTPVVKNVKTDRKRECDQQIRIGLEALTVATTRRQKTKKCLSSNSTTRVNHSP